MATYKFPQWNTEITNPTVTVTVVNDFIQEKLCNADVVLSVPDAMFSVTFIGYAYTTDWNDQDIIDWVNNVQLPMYEV
jgi:hypothetical protein